MKNKYLIEIIEKTKNVWSLVLYLVSLLHCDLDTSNHCSIPFKEYYR